MRKLSLLAASIAMINAGAALAQDEGLDQLEEITVTGIRGSLTNSMDIKRDNRGVVDAISAEDIGKFPDANLAESLQRITGVSIDRQSNEGSQITVRGMGPNFNLVTLNGRQMPTANSPEMESISSAQQSRGFNFEQLASESVAGVEVYKTARADMPTGGLGATVNIKTARPLEIGEKSLVVNAKAMHDMSVEEGRAVTPELGGLFSTVLLDGSLGLLVNASYSERNFSELTTHTDGWLRDEAGSAAYNRWCADDPSVCNGAPYIYRPVSNISERRDVNRKRTNAQFVAQYSPVEFVTATLDYTLSYFNRQEDRYGTGAFGVVTDDGGDPTNVSLSSNYSLLSATRVGKPADALVYDNELVVNNDSIGFNLEWDLSDSMVLTFDVHSSKSESQPKGELNDNLALMQGVLGVNHDITYSPNGVTIVTDDSGAFRGDGQFGGGSPIPGADYFQAPAGFSPLGLVIRNVAIDNAVDQAQLDFDWNGDDWGLSAGVAYTDFQVETTATSTGFDFQGLTFCATCPDRITLENINAPSGFGQIATFDVNSMLAEEFGRSDLSGFPLNAPADVYASAPTTFFGLSEKTTAAYVNFAKDLTLGSYPANVTAGLRYEATDVTGSGFQQFPVSLTVFSTTEGTVQYAPEEQYFEVDEDYAVVLPSIDFSVNLTDDLITRLSYGQSIARPELSALRPVTSISDYRPGVSTAAGGNPGLKPYSADNYDLSVEWYYDEGSYASAAFFVKNVEDYISTAVSSEPIMTPDGSYLLNPEDRFVSDGDPTTPDTPVTSQPGDPVALFEITKPLNTTSRSVDGVELALQHMFGESGFGVQANYTKVNSDAEFDPSNFEEQSVLIGLSDSANLVGFYENDVFSIRVAANWRDKFLFSGNQLRATNEPVYFDAYTQIDVSASYYITDNLSLVADVLNLTGADQMQSGRYSEQFLLANDQKPRVAFGIRGQF